VAWLAAEGGDATAEFGQQMCGFEHSFAGMLEAPTSNQVLNIMAARRRTRADMPRPWSTSCGYAAPPSVVAVRRGW